MARTSKRTDAAMDRGTDAGSGPAGEAASGTEGRSGSPNAVAAGPDDGSGSEVTDPRGFGSKPSMQDRITSDSSLEQVVEAARRGSHQAFEELVRRTHAEVYGLARRLVSDPDDARDVTQEAYLRAFRSIKRFRGDARFTTWMHRITANCAADHLGTRRRHLHDELDEGVALTDHHPDRDPEVHTDGALLRSDLEAAVGELPARLRAVVVLRDVYDMSHAEVAAELGISESAAKVRLHRARRKLRLRVFPSREDRPEQARDDEGVQARAV